MKMELQRYFPPNGQFLIVGDNYPLPMSRAAIAHLITFTCLLLGVLGLFGQRMEFLPPSLRAFLTANGSMLAGIAFFLFIVGGSLRQTGAFEVYVNDRLVFSKLAEGRAPTVPEVHQLILNAGIPR